MKYLPCAAIIILSFASCENKTTQNDVTITVKADQITGEIKPIWNYFDYDEANYTFT